MKQNARPVTKLSELGDDWKQYDVIGIDEGQFYLDVSVALLANQEWRLDRWVLRDGGRRRQNCNCQRSERRLFPRDLQLHP